MCGSLSLSFVWFGRPAKLPAEARAIIHIYRYISTFIYSFFLVSSRSDNRKHGTWSILRGVAPAASPRNIETASAYRPSRASHPPDRCLPNKTHGCVGEVGTCSRRTGLTNKHMIYGIAEPRHARLARTQAGRFEMHHCSGAGLALRLQTWGLSWTKPCACDGSPPSSGAVPHSLPLAAIAWNVEAPRRDLQCALGQGH